MSEYPQRNDRGDQKEQQNHRFCNHISKEAVRDALGKMKTRKAVGPDYIPVEIWKCLGEEGIEWLMELFNVIFRTAKMPHKWRFGTIILLYKNKGDI